MRLPVVLLALLAVLAAVPPARAATPVTVYRDLYGIPHVESPTFDGVAYGTGYTLAHDRPFLLAAIRLTAQGRAAELLGPGSLEADYVTRRDFYDAADVRRQYEDLSPDRKRELIAFSAGVNAGMTEVMADPRKRPALFDALGYTPEPWAPTDSVSVTMLFTYAIFAGEGGAGQLRNAALLDRLHDRHGRRGFRMWNDLLFRNDPRTVPVIPRGEGTPPRRSVVNERPGPDQRRLARELAGVLRRLAERRAAESRRVSLALRKVPIPKIGSYAVALGGSRTASGGAALIGSPQAGLNAPPVFWQVGQHSPGRECTGFTVPGLGPWTGIGWCNGHAWSLVAGNMGEQVDNYVERIDPDRPRRYRFRGAWREMDVRREVFKVNRCAPPLCSSPSPPRTETREIESTVHGPVVERDDRAGIAITQRRAQRGNWARAIEALARWNTATSLREFDRATDLANATYNLVYADRDGHILYRFTGLQPVRAEGYDRRLPSPGTGEAEWRGHVPKRAMPRVADPESAILVSNQGIESKPAEWWPNSSAVAVGQASRVRMNRQILASAGRGLDADALERVNPALLERVDGITPIFEAHLRRALRGSQGRLGEALELFDEWAKAGYPRRDDDGDGFYDAPAIAIFGADDFNLPHQRPVWSELLDRVFGDELGEERREGGERGTFQNPGTWLGRLSTLELALDGRLRHPWIDDARTGLRERRDDLIRRAVEIALVRLEREFGTPDLRSWRRPVPTMAFVPLGVAAPPPIKGFDHGTYSQIVDPRANTGRYILPPGNQAADSAADTAAAQAGRPTRHFADQREIYERYGFIDMRRAPELYRTGTESVQALEYPGP